MSTTIVERQEQTAPHQGMRIGLALLFLVFLGLLVWAVLWKLDVPFIGGSRRDVKLVPFAATAEFGASRPFELVANVLLFVPFGIYLGLLARAWRWWTSALVIAGASLALEAAQYVLAVGSSDVSDLLLNTAGGLIGLGIVAAVRRRGVKAVTTLVRVVAIGTVAALLLSALLYVASPVRYAPPQHAGTSIPLER